MIRLAIIGTGGMAAMHAREFSKNKDVTLVSCCDISRERAEPFAKKWNIPAAYCDYRQMLDQVKPDAVSNVTPDSVHCELALEILKRNIPLFSEKPLAATLAEAKKMLQAAQKASVINMVNFSYRNSSGLQAAGELISKGAIGRVIHVEASYLQSWLTSKVWGDWRKSSGWLWRLSTKHGSQGVLGDVGCHIYDLVSFLCGDISEIQCRLRTFEKDTPDQRLGEYFLDANDSFVSTVQFKNGAMGTVHATRWATGQVNSLRARVYGDKGAVEVDLDKGYDEYRVCKGKNIDKALWETVQAKATPDNYQRFIRSIETGKNDVSDFRNGAKIQAYLHCSFESDRKRKPVQVNL